MATTTLPGRKIELMTDESAPAAKPSDVDRLSINAIRVLAMDAVQKADSGHPGTPMALAPLAYVLWTRHLRYNPADPEWLDRDRFVLSAGHASMLLYSVLYLTGYDLTLDDIKQPASYRESVLPPGVKRIAIEAAHPMSWYKWVGSDGVIIGIERFGASAPYKDIYTHLGLTVDKLVDTAKQLV
jgi:transketolase